MNEFYFIGMGASALYRTRERLMNDEGRMNGSSAVEAFTEICVAALLTGQMRPHMEAFENPISHVEHAVYRDQAPFRGFTLEEQAQIKQSLRDWGVK